MFGTGYFSSGRIKGNYFRRSTLEPIEEPLFWNPGPSHKEQILFRPAYSPGSSEESGRIYEKAEITPLKRDAGLEDILD